MSYISTLKVKLPENFTIKTFKTFILDCTNDIEYAATHVDYYTKANLLCGYYTNCNHISLDLYFNGLAAINMYSHGIIINPKLLANTLIEALPFIIRNKDTFSFLFNNENNNTYFDVGNYVCYFACYLVLHEIGHHKYTIKPSDEKPLIKAALAKGMPLEFVKFVSNVVEDCFIQRRLQLDYPIEIYRDFFLLGTTIIQGPLAKISFEDSLNSSIKEGTSLPIKTKLFYFILRAYNRMDKDIQSMYDMIPTLGWTKEVLDLFDKAICILDTIDRAIYTYEVLTPALFNILHEKVKLTIDELKQQHQQSNSLLDDDKLREADVDDSSNGNSDSDKPEDDEGANKACDEESNGESIGDSDEDGEDEPKKSSDSASEDKAEESNEDNSKVDSDAENEAQNKNQSEDSKSNSDSEKQSTDSTTESTAPSEQKQDSNKSLEQQFREIEDNFIDELSNACHELNDSLDESKDRNEDVPVVESKSKKDLADVINNIKKAKPFSNRESLINAGMQARFASNGITLYNLASQLFKRIYTFDTDDMNYLDDGDLDEDTMIDFYTEKSLNIFKQHRDLVEGKKIKVLFLVDDSGSMYPKRAYNCRVIIPPLMHSFEESGIQTCLYAFGSHSYLLKDFDDPVTLVGQQSSIQYAYNNFRDSGGTYICHVLSALVMKEYDEDTIYVCFVFTDGCLDQAYLATSLCEYLRTQCHFNFFGVTIDQDYDSGLHTVLGIDESLVKNYSTDELLTKLPQDIYNTIVDKFIKK